MSGLIAILAAMFKGLAVYFDDIARLLATAGGAGALLEYLVILLAVLNVFKGPVILLGLALWRAKWGTLSNELARAGAFAAGAFTLFDWTSWELTIPRLLAALFIGGLFIKLYDALLRWLAPTGYAVHALDPPGRSR